MKWRFGLTCVLVFQVCSAGFLSSRLQAHQGDLDSRKWVITARLPDVSNFPNRLSDFQLDITHLVPELLSQAITQEPVCFYGLPYKTWKSLKAKKMSPLTVAPITQWSVRLFNVMRQARQTGAFGTVQGLYPELSGEFQSIRNKETAVFFGAVTLAALTTTLHVFDHSLAQLMSSPAQNDFIHEVIGRLLGWSAAYVTFFNPLFIHPFLNQLAMSQYFGRSLPMPEPYYKELKALLNATSSSPWDLNPFVCDPLELGQKEVQDQLSNGFSGLAY